MFRKAILLLSLFFSAPRESFWSDVRRLEDPTDEEVIAQIKSVPRHYASGALTELYTNASTGNQMNGGSSSGAPIYTATNGGWVSGTGVFTPTSGNPSSSITVDGTQMAAVFTDGSTTPAFVGRVTAASSTTVTVSVSIKIGTVPTTSASGLSIRVGGAWLGPNGATAWPVGSVTTSLVNSSSNPPRVNMVNTAAYSITAGVTQNKDGVTYQGCTTTPGDGGRATIDGSTNAIILWTQSSNSAVLADMIFSNNGTTGSNSGVSCSGVSNLFRVVAHNIRGSGIDNSAWGTYIEEAEAYLCNASNTAGSGGFGNSGLVYYERCIAHDNAGGSNAHGFTNTSSVGAGGSWLHNCIADTNAGSGARCTSTGPLFATNCDFYNNTGSGLAADGAAGSQAFATNCNFLKNTSNGVTGNSSGTVPILVVNCGFGSGTQANAATTSGRGVQEIGSLTYASGVTPWVDAANGDFRINLAAAIGVGRGAFTQTQSSYGGTTAAPVLGASQVANYPSAANVSNGTTYANGAYTGTLAAGGVSGARIFVGM